MPPIAQPRNPTQPQKAPPSPPLLNLTSRVEDCGIFKKRCPAETTLVGTDINSGRTHAFSIACKRWTCPVCSRKKARDLAQRCVDARPNRFVTLTTSGHENYTPRQVYDFSRRQISELVKQYRRDRIEFEYMRVLESTKSGYPHYHLIVRSPYLDHRELSHRWQHLTQAFIVDVRKITNSRDVVRYILKYCTKQSSVPFTNRRISQSRNFFPRRAPPPKAEYNFIDVQRHHMTLDQVLYWEHPSLRWSRVNDYHYVSLKPGEKQ